MTANNERAVLFTNISDREFIGYWNSVPYRFKPKASHYMEAWKARHFAKHLIDQILNDKNKPTNSPERATLLAEIVTDELEIEGDAEKAKTELADLNEGKTVEDIPPKAPAEQETFEA